MKKLFLIAPLIFMSLCSFSQVKFIPAKSVEQILNEEYCSGLFSTPDATYFDMLDNHTNASAMSYLNILDWLQGRVAGLQIYKTRSLISIPYIRNQQAAVYIDEVPVGPEEVNMLSVAEIAMIKIIKDPFISGWRGGGGVIAIYTIRGDDEE
jgi:hypothetical protein